MDGDKVLEVAGEQLCDNTRAVVAGENYFHSCKKGMEEWGVCRFKLGTLSFDKDGKSI